MGWAAHRPAEPRRQAGMDADELRFGDAIDAPLPEELLQDFEASNEEIYSTRVIGLILKCAL